MRWSKLKKRIEDNFAENIKSRISIHSTAYGNCSCGHAWLTLDGKVIANFCTRAFFNRYPMGYGRGEMKLDNKKTNKYKDQFVEYGEMSRQNFYLACWEYIHKMGLDEALDSENCLIQSLAVLDKRLGKKRMNNLKKANLHRLARKLLLIRFNKDDLAVCLNQIQ
ncbi:hypothetical protein [Pseudemcibacter aquimaris]|uniref:SF0329 family protein n=1 Tax=Pseudemcibacter aquimaris TaxID=2857064 RepID=UPI002013BD5C|nr:hypothetical protein [Pseudemcibacter aquimaris]MCC3860621.1 hypothetical protein [Pseudemcibacter aquimaris]WDU59440.1 hypothetical protein KW060_04100 [Pseudemcibacter aquimaris]